MGGLFFSSQENRIYDLKKKNKELEKFKFVLDYKVNELKKQIEPRENEVKEMKEQVHEVRLTLVKVSWTRPLECSVVSANCGLKAKRE